MGMPCENLRKFYTKFIEFVCEPDVKEAEDFLKIYEMELAKALVLDFPTGSPKVAKLILAFHNMDKVNIEIK